MLCLLAIGCLVAVCIPFPDIPKKELPQRNLHMVTITADDHTLVFPVVSQVTNLAIKID